MKGHHREPQKTGRLDPTPMPAFSMPAMPPLALTEAVNRRYRHWMQRRQFRRWLMLEDRHLAVLGMTREELEWVSRQPLSVDPLEALCQRREGAVQLF